MGGSRSSNTLCVHVAVLAPVAPQVHRACESSVDEGGHGLLQAATTCRATSQDSSVSVNYTFSSIMGRSLVLNLDVDAGADVEVVNGPFVAPASLPQRVRWGSSLQAARSCSSIVGKGPICIRA